VKVFIWCAFGSIVQNILDSVPKMKYIIAADDSNNTLEEITRVVCTSSQMCLMTCKDFTIKTAE